MKIEIWSDFACPFCYIGKKRFEEALEQFSHKDKVNVIYKSYQVNPNAPQKMVGSVYEAFAKSHQTTTEEAEKRFNMFTNSAKTVGLTYNYSDIKMTNTFDAHRLHKYADEKGLGGALLNRLMKAYFTDGLDLCDYDILSSLAQDVGLNKKASLKILEQNLYTNQVVEEQKQAKTVGIQGVPFFVINRQYGISGAQDVAYFLATLNQIWEETIEHLGYKDHKSIQNEIRCAY